MSEVSANLLETGEPQIVDHGHVEPTPETDADDALVTSPAEDDAPVQPAQESEPDADREQEELARSRGWVDQKDYHGKAKWVDAREYNERHESITPHLIRESKKLRDELRARDQQLAQQNAQIAELVKWRQEQQEASQTIQVQTLLAQKAQAESEGDWQTANKIGDQLIDLKLEKKVALPRQPQQPQRLDPVVQRTLEDFVADNPVFKDQESQTYLAVAAKALADAGTSKRGRDLLDDAGELAQRLFPSKFKIAPRRPAMAEMSGSPGRTNGAVRSWGDLKPDEAARQEEFLRSAFPKMDAKGLNNVKQKLLRELPKDAFRR